MKQSHYGYLLEIKKIMLLAKRENRGLTTREFNQVYFNAIMGCSPTKPKPFLNDGGG